MKTPRCMSMYSSREQLYWKRVGQRELLEKILEFLDSRKNGVSIDELKQRLGRMLIEIEQELRHYIEKTDPIYNVLTTDPVTV